MTGHDLPMPGDQDAVDTFDNTASTADAAQTIDTDNPDYPDRPGGSDTFPGDTDATTGHKIRYNPS